MTSTTGPGPPEPIRTAVVGISTAPICGVRDHAALLAGALERDGVACTMHWLDRSELSLAAARSEIHTWLRELAGELARDRPQAVLLHYSVFAYSHRGLPVFVHPTLSALRAANAPLVTLLHEFAYPWGRDGWRGAAWAVSQRMILLDVMRASRAVASTTEFQAAGLASSRWLPKRPAAIAPVFSNLPPASPASLASPSRGLIGLFGYAYDEATVSLVLDALKLAKDRRAGVRLALLGAPGRSSAAARTWLAAARSRGLADALSFSDILSPQELSDRLAGCELLLFADPSGPASRKTTLAASLASGRPVVALTGQRRWTQLIAADAARVVAPAPQALGDALTALLEDRGSREALGGRGRAFAERNMSVSHSAGVIAELIGDAVER